MTIPTRFQFAFTWLFSVAILGFFASLFGTYFFLHQKTVVSVIAFMGTVLLAPLYLLSVWWIRDPGEFSTQVLALVLVALIGLSMHPVIDRDWAKFFTAAGAIAWLACELLVAVGPA